MSNISKCDVDDCKYNRKGECNANEVEISYKSTASGYHPMCDTYYEREDCFISNEEPYPLCKGNGTEKCHDCCLYEDYEQYHSPY